jgi:hypothetical protein
MSQLSTDAKGKDQKIKMLGLFFYSIDLTRRRSCTGKERDKSIENGGQCKTS